MTGDSAPRPDLAEVIDRIPGLTMWVVGDIMLDEYLIGEVRRVSPEAPVPVVRAHETQVRLGGAANVARQAATLGARLALGGTVGLDLAGDRLLECCTDAGIDTSSVCRLADHPTTRKQRVLGSGQQLLRLDWEHPAPCSSETVRWIAGRLESHTAPAVVVLSDYGKGVLTPEMIGTMIAAGQRAGVPVLVDPKRPDLGAYRGATLVSPNLRELEAAAGVSLDGAGDDEIAAVARDTASAAGIENVVVTLGERGMLVVPGDGPHTSIRAHRRAVYDVTGAGDVAIALLALGLAAGTTLDDAARIATVAAGVAVGEVGTVAVPAAQIRDALINRHTGKVLSRSGLAAQVASWRLQGKRIVFTNGCFDLLHLGHLTLLREAAQLGDVLVLAINSDASVRRLKGPDRPLMPQAERATLLAALDCVDAVTIYDEDTPLETLFEVRPDVLVKGQDYRIHEVVGRELVESSGGRVELLPLLPEHSTSKLVERIRRAVPARPED